MKYIVSINDKNYEVEVERGEARIIKTTQAIQVETTQETTAVRETASVAQQASRTTQASAGDGEAIKAPMPGTILDIKVNTGVLVKSGEILLILEAMKMENEIVAPRDGVVTQILVTKGSSVNTGDTLVMLK